MDFSDIIKKLVDQNVRISFHQGVVQSTSASPVNSVTVRISGDSTNISGVRYLSSYTPTVDDVVWILINGGDLIVLGELA
jgi:hypothetical protein